MSIAVRVIVSILLVSALTAQGAIELASPFTDHAVLQRDLPVPIWGTADPSEPVTVIFAGQKKTTSTDDEGRWRVTLEPMNASPQGRNLVIKGNDAEAQKTLSDIVVGEVWLCVTDSTIPPSSGLLSADSNAESAIRILTVSPARAAEPQSQSEGTWLHAKPDEASTLAAAFAGQLARKLGVPVGIIAIPALRSTPQAWISREAIAADPMLRPVLEEFDLKLKSYAPPTEEQVKQWQESAGKKKASPKSKSAKRPIPIRKINVDPVQDPRSPTVLFNGAVTPLLPYAVRGVVWWHGETTARPRDLYPRWWQTVVVDWQRQWRLNDTPKDSQPFWFLLGQLATVYHDVEPGQLRRWQADAIGGAATGLIVTLDLDDSMEATANRNRELGRRFSLLARAKVYGEPIECSGPCLEKITNFGGSLKLEFSHAVGGLREHESPTNAFEIAEAEGEFHLATVHLDGKTVYLSSPDVALPMRVRYGWDQRSPRLLYNADDLPAAPFEASASN